MRMLKNKDLRLQATITMSILLALILLSQLTVTLMANQFKESMIAHDYAIAGYMSKSGIDGQQIIKAFTSEKANADEETGSSLLTASGYKESIPSSLLPEVEHFRQKYGLRVLTFSIVIFLILLAVFFYFALHYYKKLEHAVDKLRCFMDGETDIRLEDSKEDSLSSLFAAVNSMATSLTAHIEKEKQSREFLKDTISDISHQLKTPLASLRMYNDIVLEEKIENDVVESFTLKSKCELLRMETLIQNLLKLAKLDAGTIELEKSTYSLKDFLEKCQGTFITRARLEGKGLILQCGNSASLYMDEIWLEEAVGNIIKNALDHTCEGNQIEIIGAETVIANEITVKDNGTGIHPEDIHHIFKRFYRSRSSKDRQGVGIGLALSKAIVEQHGGTISVQSELEKGTSFHLIFPKLSNL